MVDLLIGSLISGAVFVSATLISASLLAFLLAKLWRSLSADLIVRLSAVPVPILATVALLSLILTPIGVEDNGPQISGGIMIGIGLILVAAFGYFFGAFSARWTLRKVHSG